MFITWPTWKQENFMTSSKRRRDTKYHRSILLGDGVAKEKEASQVWLLPIKKVRRRRRIDVVDILYWMTLFAIYTEIIVTFIRTRIWSDLVCYPEPSHDVCEDLTWAGNDERRRLYMKASVDVWRDDLCYLCVAHAKIVYNFHISLHIWVYASGE